MAASSKTHGALIVYLSVLRILVKRLVCMNFTWLILLYQVLLILWVWQIQCLLFLNFVWSTLYHWWWVADEDVGVVTSSLCMFGRTLTIALIVAEWWSCVLSCTRRSNSVVVLRVQSASDSTLVHLISGVLNRIRRLVDYILLELSAVLILHRNGLHRLLLVVVHVVAELVWVYFDVLLLTWWHLMASYSWSCAWVLWVVWFSAHWYSVASSILFLHLLVQGFSLIENPHQFFIYLVAIKLFQNLLLMLKLVLRLLGLLRSLLLLNQCIGIFWLGCLLASWCDEILAVALSSSFGWRARLWLLAVVWFVGLARLVLMLLNERLGVATHAQILLICISEIIVVYNVHW